jgi:hypothetical protein
MHFQKLPKSLDYYAMQFAAIDFGLMERNFFIKKKKKL